MKRRHLKFSLSGINLLETNRKALLCLWSYVFFLVSGFNEKSKPIHVMMIYVFCREFDVQRAADKKNSAIFNSGFFVFYSNYKTNETEDDSQQNAFSSAHRSRHVWDKMLHILREEASFSKKTGREFWINIWFTMAATCGGDCYRLRPSCSQGSPWGHWITVSRGCKLCTLSTLAVFGNQQRPESLKAWRCVVLGFVVFRCFLKSEKLCATTRLRQHHFCTGQFVFFLLQAQAHCTWEGGWNNAHARGIQDSLVMYLISDSVVHRVMNDLVRD